MHQFTDLLQIIGTLGADRVATPALHATRQQLCLQTGLVGRGTQCAIIGAGRARPCSILC